MRPLTYRQLGLLRFVTAYQKEHGFLPSTKEIANSLGYRSTGSVWHQMHQLERFGYVSLHPYRPRAFEVLARSEKESPGAEAHSLEDPSMSYSETAVMTPVLGHITANKNLLALKNIEDIFVLPRLLVGYGDIFLLRAKGDSMVDAAILHDDWIAVRRQSTADDGQIVVALIEGEATVKVLRHHQDHVWLEPRNSNYTPISGDQASVLGIVVAVLRSL